MDSLMITQRTGWLVPLAVLVFLLGCASHRQGIRVTAAAKDTSEMESMIRETIPAGTALADARDFMEREGFSCHVIRNGSFSEQGEVYEGIDYIHCYRDDATSFWVHRCWQIALVLEDDTVTDVRVSSVLDGP